MIHVFESESFVLPSQLKNDIADRLKDTKGIKAVELQLKGESLEGAKEFSRMLVGLKKQGVRISHEFSIKLEFPRSITRERALSLVESMPRSRNGSLKVRIQYTGSGPSAGE